MREKLIRWIVALSSVDLLLVVLLLCLVLFPASAHSTEVTFHSVHDRPVLETVQQVWEARTTGISTLSYNGHFYIIKDLPKEYIDYSSWYVRMP